jgi:hypothetical protein
MYKGGFQNEPVVVQHGPRPQLKREPPCPLCLSSFNTEHTERLSELCVEAFLTTENTETLHTAGKMFSGREGADCQRYRGPRMPHYMEVRYGDFASKKPEA